MTTETRLETAPGPPTIEGQTAVAGELAAARINGTLCLTDAACGLWTLQLPDLAWRSLDDEPSSECRFAVSATGQHLIGNADWSPTGHLGAAERERTAVGLASWSSRMPRIGLSRSRAPLRHSGRTEHLPSSAEERCGDGSRGPASRARVLVTVGEFTVDEGWLGKVLARGSG